MSGGREVVVLSGVRTAIGDYGSAFKDVPPTELAAQVVREAVKRAKIEPQQVGQLVFGNVIHGEAKDMYFSRMACRQSSARRRPSCSATPTPRSAAARNP
jgi:acetyl-CoA C-acetyltransferase